VIAYQEGPVTVHHGDCLEVLRTLPDESVHAVVTDPPYGIRFMGQAWDGADIETVVARGRETNPMPDGVGGPRGGYRSAAAEAGRYNQSGAANRAFQAWCESWAAECLRVLKPGGHLLASGSPRTAHRLSAGIEDAGFEIRDSIAWLYGSGFPKSLDIGKVLAEWKGWGTALKPGFEPITVARKPFPGTVADNVSEHGTGAMNIGGTRIAHANAADLAESEAKNRHATFGSGPRGNKVYNADNRARGDGGDYSGAAGRWPTNVALDQVQADELDRQSGMQTDGVAVNRNRGDERPMNVAGAPRKVGEKIDVGYGGKGGASRFFYVAKAPASERPEVDGVQHPTVKPLDLMQWLVRLVTPAGGTVLDPFAGSGTTLEAAVREGFTTIGIEREAEYLPLILKRVQKDHAQSLFGDDL
jgi:DNA modification methylase